ncbi:MAG: hypothetical protein BGN88_14940 [Clostridiales bacterium 43-6]|nr:MAG: hypothetical protein BGN88_14940 [Clostridiales bacterium 43-6]
MILSVSRRTDIPCYYGDWFINRLQAGYVLTRNPKNHSQISKIPLSPDNVDCLVFWTKDPQNMLAHLPALDEMGYRYYFQFTLTPYGKDMEPNLRNKQDITDTFIKLSSIIGSHRVLWRYDPIVLNDRYDIAYHKNEFSRLCEKLHPYTTSVTISFVDTYKKLKTKWIREITTDEIIELSDCIGRTAAKYSLSVKACCESMDLTSFGIVKASCIDKDIIEAVTGSPLLATADKNQRNGCGCYASTDIGAYNTCQNGCVYCYANFSAASVKHNCEKHDEMGELLIGKVSEGETMKERN